MRFLIIILIIFPNFSLAASMKMIGEKGKISEVNRVVEIIMYDNYYSPNKLKILKNETIKFVIHNSGELVHEFNIATKEMHIKHQPEMALMVEKEILLADKIDYKKMKEASKKDHSMGHSHSNSILLEPGKKGELIWKFNTDLLLEAACNIPGHYESGMVAKIN